MIGIIGGSGNVGRHVVSILEREQTEPLRVGSRNTSRSDNSQGQLNIRDVMAVDIDDISSIKAFITDCKIVINCAKVPTDSEELTWVVANNGSDYIDVGMIDRSKIASDIPDNCSVIYGAGSTPGLSGILPRWFANDFAKVKNLKSYYAALGRFTKTAARDYLDGLFHETNKSMMIWKNGQVAPYVTDGNPGRVRLFNRELKSFPYFDNESLYVAKELDLKNGEWYMTLDGECTLKVLETAKYHYPNNPAQTIQSLHDATKADCAGDKEYAGFVIQIDGEIKRRELSRTLSFLYDSPAELTGLTAAVTVIAVKEQRIPPGVYPLGECGNARAFMQILQRIKTSGRLEVHKGPICELYQEIEGEI